MIIDCISDTHGHYPDMEGGDLLIVAGDLTAGDTDYEYWQFNKWIKDRANQYGKIIVIGGNHDNLLIQTSQRHMAHTYCHPAEYLCDSSTEFEGLKIWGSPWTKTFKGMNPACMAFTEQTENDLIKHFEKIPHDTDILVTHSPAFEVLDEVSCMWHDREVVEHCGSKYLYGWLKYSGRPKLHVCGHIHEAYGKREHFTSCISVNASYMNGRYEPVNAPIRVVL